MKRLQLPSCSEQFRMRFGRRAQSGEMWGIYPFSPGYRIPTDSFRILLCTKLCGTHRPRNPVRLQSFNLQRTAPESSFPKQAAPVTQFSKPGTTFCIISTVQTGIESSPIGYDRRQRWALLSCRLPHSRTAGVSVWESITEVESSFAYRDYLVGESTSEATIRETKLGWSLSLFLFGMDGPPQEIQV